MSKLEELIQELCPDGVEYKTLGELGKFFGGLTGKSKDDFKDGNAKFITYKNVYANPALQIDVEDRVKIADGEKQRTLQYGDVIFTGSSETPDECGISSVVTMKTDEKLYLNSFCFFFRFNDLSIMLPDFAKHLFRSSDLRYQIGKTASGVTRYNVSKKLMEKVLIPIPSIPIQREIVRILDNFTELTAELTAELIARKKQYEYYRDELLTFEDDIPLAILGDVAVVTKLAGFEFTKYVRYSDSGNIIALRGLNVKNGKLNLTDVKYIDNSDFSKLTRSKLHIGDMLFTYVGTIGQVALIDEEDKYYLAPNVALIRSIDDRLSPQYMRYYFQSSNFWKTQINKLLQSSSMQNIPMEKIRKFTIPLPSVEEQQRIVAILDSFDALCNDLTSGLPAEIEARQKQYEYYRDKLLQFRMKNA